MKLMHLSDLHLGKRVYEFSMIEDQHHILDQILEIADKERPDAVLIAGDVYDKSQPSIEAVELLDWFLVQLAERKLPVFIISGNHDSAERLAFGNRLMEGTGIHIASVFQGISEPISLTDQFGEVRLYLLPFVKPVQVKKAFPDASAESYTDAVKTCIDAMKVDPSVRNVLVTHQFVTGASRSESEEISVGGTDNVDASVFDAFDYVALGHIHGPQNIGSERIRYCGTPLKYSFSEASHTKSITLAELGPKGELTVSTIPFEPLRDLKEIKGTYSQLTLKSFYEEGDLQKDYLHITLTDEDDVVDAAAKLRIIYPNLMTMDYDNSRTRHQACLEDLLPMENKSELELFEEFFKGSTGADLNDKQMDYLAQIIEEIKEQRV